MSGYGRWNKLWYNSNIFSKFLTFSVGFGNSTSKKDAQSNAARDFGQFLVREGLVTAQELPQLQVQVYFTCFTFYFICSILAVRFGSY